jgi:multiple sugar transport system ATP-binding protein
MASLTMEKLNKIYDNGCHAVCDLDLDVADGEFIVLVGPSGCGKSTTLRMIAGLEEITKGRLFIGKKDVTNMAPSDRDIAMVFQNYALYPQMTVYQNLAFALNMRRVRVRTAGGKILKKHLNPDNIHRKVMDAAEMLGLLNQLNKKPKQLSGGQQQRVAVGRAIVREPKVFLFDEPLSNLDAKLRSEMRHELKLLHQKLKVTMIYVTHDQTEALTLADRIVVMDRGRILQVGTPLQIYKNPANIFVASFIGLPPMNLIDVEIDSNGCAQSKYFYYKPRPQLAAQLKPHAGKKMVMGVRPEHINLNGDIEFVVNINENLGQFTLVHGHIKDKKIICKLLGWHSFSRGDKLYLGFDDNNIHFFDKQTSLAVGCNV